MTRARRTLVIAGRAAGLVLALSAVAIAALWAVTDVDRARFVRPADSITITDRSGEPLRQVRSEGYDRRWVSLDRISPHLVDAVIAVEDRRFYEHEGVDARAVARAALTSWWPGRRASGASTITQQLVKRVYGRPHGLWDKPREMMRALLLEEEMEKDWILEQYLNRLPFGDNIVGVARASEAYFGRPPSELSLPEAALLAGIPQAPSALDPRRHLPAAIRRQRFVLARMRDLGRVDEASYRAAVAAPITIRARDPRPWSAPRFADAALEELRAGRLSRRGGVVRTSLDLVLHERVERILERAVQDGAPRGVTNAAAIVVANETGEILAYVGAARAGQGAPGAWLDLLRARRQPGSTLKPFVYELFFERGGTAASLLDDLSTPMTGGAGELYLARDYDGRERGPLRARAALSASSNLAALDAARRVGPERIVARLSALGFTELAPPDRYGAAIVLGGADVRPVDLAGAYVTLARGGTRVPLSYGPTDGVTPVRVLEPAAARITRDVLADGAARREAFGDDLRALFGEEPFALKTGTSHGWRDAWTAAFTDAFTVVVWLGDPGGRPLAGLSGFEGAARPAVRVLAAAHERMDALGIQPAAGEEGELAQARVCAATGLLAGPRCSHAIDERFAPGTVPRSTCDAHRSDGRVALPPRYARWIEAARPAGFALGDAQRSEAPPRVEHPRDGARLVVDPRRSSAIPLRASVEGAPAEDARFEVDGAALEEPRWVPEAGEHVIVAIVGGRRSEPVSVTVTSAR